MTTDETARRNLMAAGAAAVRFNAPLGERRATKIVEFVGANARTVVDLGCGRGSLAIELARAKPQLRCVGIDSDAEAIEQARVSAVIAADGDLGQRVSFEVGDVSEWATPSDAALCIGASHAFGGSLPMLETMRSLGRSAAVIGDAVWDAPPTAGQHAMFGDLPDGEDGLVALAVSAGWTVADQDRSTLEEWDEFEAGWIGGVRALGTRAATTFADDRQDQYRSYRGVLGFGWLLLTR